MGLPRAWAGSLTLDTLMSALHAAGPRTVQFDETHQIAALDVPLKSHGEMEYRPPDYLRRTTVVQDRREQIEIDGNQVRVERGGKQERFSLDAVPGLGGFALSLRAVLGGDTEALRRHFDMNLTGSAAAWSLTLRPRDAAAKQWMQEISFSGEEANIRRIETLENSGDRVTTLIRK